MVKVLQSYALVAVGVKIIVTNVAAAGPTGGAGTKQTVLATPADTRSLLDTTSILFGATFASTLMPLTLEIQLEALASKEGAAMTAEGAATTADGSSAADAVSSAQAPPPAADGPVVSIGGFISKVGEGVGRSDNERQFLYLNGRPVDNARFNRAMNEVWRRYEMKHKPAFVLALRVPPGLFDVNVTPDKREVVLVHEAAIVERLRAAVDALYEPSRYTFRVEAAAALEKTPSKSLPSIVSSTSMSDSQSSGEGSGTLGNMSQETAPDTAESQSSTSVAAPLSESAPISSVPALHPSASAANAASSGHKVLTQQKARSWLLSDGVQSRKAAGSFVWTQSSHAQLRPDGGNELSSSSTAAHQPVPRATALFPAVGLAMVPECSSGSSGGGGAAAMEVDVDVSRSDGSHHATEATPPASAEPLGETEQIDEFLASNKRRRLSDDDYPEVSASSPSATSSGPQGSRVTATWHCDLEEARARVRQRAATATPLGADQLRAGLSELLRRINRTDGVGGPSKFISSSDSRLIADQTVAALGEETDEAPRTTRTLFKTVS